MRVVLGMVLFHLLSASAAEIGSQWDPCAVAWVRPGLPLLSNLAWPHSAFQSCPFLMLGVTRLLLIFVGGERFSSWASFGHPWFFAAP